MARHRVIVDPLYGYLRLDPVPTQEELGRFYADQYYSESTVFRDFTGEPKKEELEHFERRCDDIFFRIHQHFGFTERLSLLDIGCGYGHLLEFFSSKGFQTAGVEPSREAAAHAASQGLNVSCKEVEACDFGLGAKYDVIVFMDVLEHLREPWRVLQYVRENLLTEKGLLVVDVPNDFNDFQLAADTAYRLDQWWVTSPAHINYFSGTTIRNLLSKCGYSVKWCESSFPLEIFLLMGDVYVGSAETGRLCHRKRVLFERNMKNCGKGEKLRQLYEALGSLDLGRQVVAYATQK